MKARTLLLAAAAMALSATAAWSLGGETDPMWVYNQGTTSAAVTPSDTTVLTNVKAIYNGAASACAIAMKLKNDSAAVTWSNVQPGAILPVAAKVVMSTNTTCTGMVAISGPQ